MLREQWFFNLFKSDCKDKLDDKLNQNEVHTWLLVETEAGLSGVSVEVVINGEFVWHGTLVTNISDTINST